MYTLCTGTDLTDAGSVGTGTGSDGIDTGTIVSSNKFSFSK